MTEQEKTQRMREIYSLMCEYLPCAEYMTTGEYDEGSDDYDELHDICYQFTVDIDIETLKEKVFGQEYKGADLGVFWCNNEIFGWCSAIVEKEQLDIGFGNGETQSDYNNIHVDSIFSDNALERIEEALKIFADSLEKEEVYTAGEYYSAPSVKVNAWKKFMMSPALEYNPSLLKHSRDELIQSFADCIDKYNTLRAKTMMRADEEKIVFTAVMIMKDYTVEIVDLFYEPLPEYKNEDGNHSDEYANKYSDDSILKAFGNW